MNDLISDCLMHHQNNFPSGGFIVSRQELSPAGVPLQEKMSSNLLLMIILVKTGQLVSSI